jgi:dihydroxy-acid dehydratase
VKLTEEEISQRTPSLKSQEAYANPVRGWQRMYIDHVMQSDKGADLDFLRGSSGPEVTRESH